MNERLPTIKNVKRIQLRISEEVLAELACARRQAGCRSWDEFYRTVVQCWQQRGQQSQPSKPECGARAELEALRERMGWFETNQKLHLALAEYHEEALQAMQQELTETLEAVRRVVNILNHAMNGQTERPPSPLDKVRRRLPV